MHPCSVHHGKKKESVLLSNGNLHVLRFNLVGCVFGLYFVGDDCQLL